MKRVPWKEERATASKAHCVDLTGLKPGGEPPLPRFEEIRPGSDWFAERQTNETEDLKHTVKPPSSLRET